MKRILCGLLVFCLLLPALAFAAPSQKLQAIYDSVDTLNVEELVALQDYVNAKSTLLQPLTQTKPRMCLTKIRRNSIMPIVPAPSPSKIKTAQPTRVQGMKSSPTAINRAKNVIPKLQADASEFNSVLLSQA